MQAKWNCKILKLLLLRFSHAQDWMQSLFLISSVQHLKTCLKYPPRKFLDSIQLARPRFSKGVIHPPEVAIPRGILKAMYSLRPRDSQNCSKCPWQMCCQCRKCAYSCQGNASLWSCSFLQGLRNQEAQKEPQSRQAPAPFPNAWRE